MPHFIVGIDPGTSKCGLAVLNERGHCLQRVVVSTSQWPATITRWAREYTISVLVLGDRTGSADFHRQLEAMLTSEPHLAGVGIAMVDEHLSSVQGRRLYLLNHRSGWRRLIPLGLQYPSEPYDDYVAEVLARRYIDRR